MTFSIGMAILVLILVIVALYYIRDDKYVKVVGHVYPKPKVVLLVESLVCILGGLMFYLGLTRYILFKYVWIVPILLQYLVVYVRIKGAEEFFAK